MVAWCATCRQLAATHFLCLSFTPLQQASGRLGREKRWAELRNDRIQETSKDGRDVRGWRGGEAVSETEQARKTTRQRQQRGRKGRGRGARDAGKEEGTSAWCVREDISHCVSTSLSLDDLFYPPSACWRRDEKRLMNNRRGGEMDENEAAFPSFTSPSLTAPLLPFLRPPFFNFNSRTKKDFINN